MRKERALKITSVSAAAIYALCSASPMSFAHAAPEDTGYEDWFEDDQFGLKEEYDSTLDLVIDRLYWGLQDDTEEGGEPESETESDNEKLPEKFDLRDADGVCYVPEVRNQTPFGTCWSFGAIAASEISIAHELGLDYNTMTDEEKSFFDLSEKHLAWFSYTAISGDPLVYGSQMGEGYHFASLDDGIDNDEETHIPYNWGGFAHFASVLFSEGIGPASEINVPYLNKEGKWEINISRETVDENWYTEYGENEIGAVAPDQASIDAYIAEYLKEHPGLKNYDTEFDGPGEYYSCNVYRSETGDWSLDENERFQGFFLKESNMLPSPAQYTDDGYGYNEKATIAIKKELLAGRGVAVNFCSDQSYPSDMLDPEDTYLNFLTEDGEPTEFTGDAAIWAHYTYDKNYDPNDPYSYNSCIGSNHSVCIVGYDDGFPKEYFNDPKGTIGGDGAWIVRNSWGCANCSDKTAENSWGNNGDGYFYLSYYDQSINEPESYVFSLFDPENMGRSLDIYDLFPSFSYTVATFDSPVYMANVFTSDSKEVLRDLGIMTALPELEAHLSVYLLNDDFKSPTDGEKVSECEDFFEHMGYHTAKLDDKVLIDEDQIYSVVLELKRRDGKYVYEINSASNRTAYNSYSETWKEDYINMYGSLDGYVDENPLYAQLIINEDESWLGVKDEDTEEWKDLSIIRTTFDEYNTEYFEIAYLDYDNFPIRSYPYSDQIHAENHIDNVKPVYDAGDVINGTITVTNATSRYTYNDVTISCSLTDLGEDGKIGALSPNETKTINYSYTVTEDDLGSDLTSRITLHTEGYNYVFLEEFEPEVYILKLAEKKPELTLPSIPDEKPAEETAPAGERSFIPILIISAASLLFVASITAIIIVAVRKKKNK